MTRRKRIDSRGPVSPAAAIPAAVIAAPGVSQPLNARKRGLPVAAAPAAATAWAVLTLAVATLCAGRNNSVPAKNDPPNRLSRLRMAGQRCVAHTLLHLEIHRLFAFLLRDGLVTVRGHRLGLKKDMLHRQSR